MIRPKNYNEGYEEQKWLMGKNDLTNLDHRFTQIVNQDTFYHKPLGSPDHRYQCKHFDIDIENASAY